MCDQVGDSSCELNVLVVSQLGGAPEPGAVVIRAGKRRPTSQVVADAMDDAAERKYLGCGDGNYRLSFFATFEILAKRTNSWCSACFEVFEV
jgi:hypothetical protein